MYLHVNEAKLKLLQELKKSIAFYKVPSMVVRCFQFSGRWTEWIIAVEKYLFHDNYTEHYSEVQRDIYQEKNICVCLTRKCLRESLRWIIELLSRIDISWVRRTFVVITSSMPPRNAILVDAMYFWSMNIQMIYVIVDIHIWIQ